MKDQTIPTFSIQATYPLNISVSKSLTQLQNDNLTFNQAGYSFNQPGVAFQGFYFSGQDIIPILSQVELPPITITFEDNYQYHAVPTPGNQQIVGVGWFMYVSSR